MTGTAFTIGSGNMYAFEFCMRIAQCFAECNGIMQVFFIGCCANAAEHGQVAVEIVDGLLVVHRHKYSRYKKTGNYLKLVRY